MQGISMNGVRPDPGQTIGTGLRRLADPDRDLRRRQREHLRQVQTNVRSRPSDCLHNRCTECIGTGIRKDGRPCIHHISCPCGRCNARL